MFPAFTQQPANMQILTLEAHESSISDAVAAESVHQLLFFELQEDDTLLTT